VEKLVAATDTFFPEQYGGGDIMVEVACDPQGTCNNDQPSFKAYLARWMAATVQIAPFTEEIIMKRLRASALGAAKQCSGGPQGRTCGRQWYNPVYDGKTGVGEEMSALSVIQANLIQKVAPPLTADTGGVSRSDPSAGTQGDDPVILDPTMTRKITMGDRAGAGILTALTLGSLLATIYWISF
jgi:mannan endo-1,6-alpha-mannosidase